MAELHTKHPLHPLQGLSERSELSPCIFISKLLYNMTTLTSAQVAVIRYKASDFDASLVFALSCLEFIGDARSITLWRQRRLSVVAYWAQQVRLLPTPIIVEAQATMGRFASQQEKSLCRFQSMYSLRLHMRCQYVLSPPAP